MSTPARMKFLLPQLKLILEVIEWKRLKKVSNVVLQK